METLFALVYDDLRRLAGAMLRDERTGHTLQATALVHEAYLRLGDHVREARVDRAHFLALAAQAMRRVLCDHARGRGRVKRGAGRGPCNLDEDLVFARDRAEQILALDDALRRLAALSPRAAHIVEMRYFGGLRDEDAAAVLGVSVRTVERDWRYARAWLVRELGEPGKGTRDAS